MKALLDKRITDLVSENYVYASVLHYFGIQFYNYSEHTLAQVCHNKGLNVKQVVTSLESALNQPTAPADLIDLPIDLIIQYLKHTHYLFIKHKLPYVAQLIADLRPHKIQNQTLVRDLQMLFPLLVEDFVKHIYEEEDTFFAYILTLHQAQSGKINLAKLYFEMEKNSIQFFALDHHTHNDEMRGIREITNNYALDSPPILHLQVIFEELKDLEKEIQKHAQIEDEILFVKAMQLEKQIKEKLNAKIGLN
ncbi:MAG: iron-sulfur cluster repair di-iron protein [Microscillaceae bacterium]|jgi:regulator of cell morphogenesis and NO signaling|nr:iron-sulfur cluster repair di-iron protein [Microscillaceae bacterium]